MVNSVPPMWLGSGLLVKKTKTSWKKTQYGTDPVKVLERIIETRMQQRRASQKRLQ